MYFDRRVISSFVRDRKITNDKFSVLSVLGSVLVPWLLF